MNLTHNTFGNIYIEKRGEQIWFSAADVCNILGYKNSRDAIKNHVPDKHADVANRYIRSENGIEQQREVVVINESGLYRLIMRSRMPEAERFTDWVTEEVLPAIRKNGYYENAASKKTGQLASRALLREINKMLSTTDLKKIADKHKVRYFHVLYVLEGKVCDVPVLESCLTTAAHNRKILYLFNTTEGIAKLRSLLNEVPNIDKL